MFIHLQIFILFFPFQLNVQSFDRPHSAHSHKTQLNHLEKSSKKKRTGVRVRPRIRPIPKQMSILVLSIEYTKRKCCAAFKCLWNCSDNEHEAWSHLFSVCTENKHYIYCIYCWSITCSHASFFIIVFSFPFGSILKCPCFFKIETKMRTAHIHPLHTI